LRGFKVHTGNAPTDKLCPWRFLLATFQPSALCYLFQQFCNFKLGKSTEKSDSDKGQQLISTVMDNIESWS